MFANNRVFFISASIIFLLVLVGAFLPEQFANVANQAQAYVGQYFGWFYLASIFCFVVFLLYLAFGKYGKIRLGPQDSTPDFSFFLGLICCFLRGLGWAWCFMAWLNP